MDVTPLQLIRPEILDMTAYPVADASGMVKLDAMENPYPLPAALRARLGDALADARINRYPNPQAPSLKAKLAQSMGIDPGFEILLGNGSDEIIQIITTAMARPGATLLSLEPSFVMYKVCATLCKMNYVGVPLNADFTLDLDRTLAAIRAEKPALIFLAYPNNPTGNLFDRDAVRQLIEATSGLVVMDEAYFPFNDQTFLTELSNYSNVVLMRTVSKLGLAGLRLGFLIGRPAWVKEFDKVRPPYNVNLLTQLAAEIVLSDSATLLEQTQSIRRERERLFAALGKMPAVTTFASAANFILFRVERAGGVFDGLKQRGILVKNLSASHPQLANCLRTTVGTAEENDRFLAALEETLRA